jgi:uncharacterized membrane protein
MARNICWYLFPTHDSRHGFSVLVPVEDFVQLDMTVEELASY